MVCSTNIARVSSTSNQYEELETRAQDFVRTATETENSMVNRALLNAKANELEALTKFKAHLSILRQGGGKLDTVCLAQE
jgi:hypothetical protein